MNLETKTVILTKNYKGQEIEISIDFFRQKVISMLIGGAIGDALGIPVEMKSHYYIKEKHGKVVDYLDPSLNYFFNKGGYSTNKKGVVSDDTLLTFAGVKSILETGKIDFDNILKLSISAYKNFPYGFGGGTKRAFSRYEELELQNPGNKNYILLGDKNSAGNGVIMKQSPFSAYFLYNNIKQIDQDIIIEILSGLTHGNPTVKVAALVHNMFLMELIKSDNEIDFSDLLNNLIIYCEENEKILLKEGNNKVSDLLKTLLLDYNNGGLKSYDEILNKYGWKDKSGDLKSKIKNKYFEFINRYGYGTKNIFGSGYVITTLGIVYSIFLNKQNFEGLLDAINIGGDTDTYGAIIGNMIGAYRGKFYDDKYLEGLDKSEELLLISEKFVDKILSK